MDAPESEMQVLVVNFHQTAQPLATALGELNKMMQPYDVLLFNYFMPIRNKADSVIYQMVENIQTASHAMSHLSTEPNERRKQIWKMYCGYGSEGLFYKTIILAKLIKTYILDNPLKEDLVSYPGLSGQVPLRQPFFTRLYELLMHLHSIFEKLGNLDVVESLEIQYYTQINFLMKIKEIGALMDDGTISRTGGFVMEHKIVQNHPISRLLIKQKISSNDWENRVFMILGWPILFPQEGKSDIKLIPNFFTINPANFSSNEDFTSIGH